MEEIYAINRQYPLVSFRRIRQRYGLGPVRSCLVHHHHRNILWFLLGGFVSGMAWVLSGAVWCITIIGIPYGLQCFKFAGLSFWPFGRRIEYGGGAVSFIVNVIWFLLNGWWMALGNLAIGCVWCITIIGIPFGIQFFKIAKLSLSPFGATIVRD